MHQLGVNSAAYSVTIEPLTVSPIISVVVTVTACASAFFFVDLLKKTAVFFNFLLVSTTI